jgi:hypothetical protein
MPPVPAIHENVKPRPITSRIESQPLKSLCVGSPAAKGRRTRHTGMSSDPLPEIESARRQVHEFEHRIARQRVLVVEMEGRGYTRSARIGRKLLSVMRTAAAMARDRLRHLEH